MGNYYDLVEGLKAAWTRWRDPELLKWVALEFATGIATIVIVGGLLIAMVGFDTLMRMASNEPAAQLQSVNALARAIVPFALTVILAGTAFVLACFFFFQPRIMRAALVANGAKVPKKMPSVVEWLILHIRIFCVTISCWYDKKLLIPAAVLIGLAVLCALAGFFVKAAFVGAFIFAFLGGVCWAGAMMVHGLRTGFATWMFIRGDGPENKMPMASNNLVRGQTLEVFMTNFCFGVVLGFAAVGIGIVRAVLGFIPCVGPMIDMAINLCFEVFSLSFTNSIHADIFLFFDKAGPVATPAKQKTKSK